LLGVWISVDLIGFCFQHLQYSQTRREAFFARWIMFFMAIYTIQLIVSVA
jgi:hypothetical protein